MVTTGRHFTVLGEVMAVSVDKFKEADMNIFSIPSIRKALVGGLFVCAAAVSSMAVAGGTYDGAWTITGLPNSYFIVYQNGDQILAVELLADKSWDAYLGTLSGSSATFTSLIASVNLNATVTFSSATTATLRVNSCSPSYDCSLPAGTQTTINKIF